MWAGDKKDELISVISVSPVFAVFYKKHEGKLSFLLLSCVMLTIVSISHDGFLFSAFPFTDNVLLQ